MSQLPAWRRWVGLAPVLLAVLALLVTDTGRVAAAQSTSISIINPPTEATIGQDVAVSARITANGAPVTSRLLVLILDGTTLRTASVDRDGFAQLTIKGAEIPHAHTATVVIKFSGSPALAPSQSSFTLVVKPAQVTIETVPSMDGVTLSLGAATAVTTGGVAVFQVPTIGGYTLIPNINTAASGSVRADFVRWSDEVFSAVRRVNIEGDLVLQLGLRVVYRGSIEFRDTSGARLDPSEIDSVTLTSGSGEGETLTGTYDSIWLEGGSAVKKATGADKGGTGPQVATLVVTPRAWRVVEVLIHGTNVVNRGQQSTRPTAGAVWRVTVLLFDLSIQGHDALLGSLLSGTVDLQYPDGAIVSAKLGKSSPLKFPRLPRGNYTLRLHAGGLAAATPVALSRSQAVAIRVITFLDVGMVGGVALVGVSGLLWFGRRRQVLRVLTGTQHGLTAGWQVASGAILQFGRTARAAASGMGGRVSSEGRTSGEGGRSELPTDEVIRRIKAPATSGEILAGEPPGSSGAATARRRLTCAGCGRFLSAQARSCPSCGLTIPRSIR